jgi:thymidylate synthase (FAD)
MRSWAQSNAWPSKKELTMDHNTRVVVPALDAILGQKLPVLDDGFVRAVDYMGGDESIVQAARISYGRGTKTVREDRGLIRYLMRHRHTTPFEMCELKLHVRVPMDTWRQWIRHRTANVNEYSTRYSEAIDAAQRTAPNEWRSQATANRQGSEGLLDLQVGEDLSRAEQGLLDQARKVYEARLKAGVAREQARKDLPLSTYTEAYWKIDLHNLLHFLSLRMDPHAQHEIRAYANAIGNQVVSAWCPIAWEAFSEYRLSSISLSNLESRIVRALVADDTQEALDVLSQAGLLSSGGQKGTRSRELAELESKLGQLGFRLPWTDVSG